MLRCYFVVATLFNTGAFTAGETPAPVPLKHFDNIAYEISINHKEDFIKVFKAIGLNDEAIKNSYASYPEKSNVTLQTPKEAGEVYVLIQKIPGKEDILTPFMLNKTVTLLQGSVTFLVEGDKLIDMNVLNNKTLKAVWEFSDDQVIETWQSGDAKASRVWKAQKTVNSKQ